MRKNNRDSGAFLLLAGVLIISVFVYVSAKNILPNNSSDSFFSKDDNGLKANINELKFEDGKIVVYTDTDVYVCAKQTKSKPNDSSLCWEKTENKMVQISAYVGRTYYIWLMDEEKNVGNYIQYNTNNNDIRYE